MGGAPATAGLLLNMVNGADPASLEVARAVRATFPARVFLAEIPRSQDFNAAATRGAPAAVEHKAYPQLASIFEALAAEVSDRLVLRAATSPAGGSFLLA
jgi:cellulose biosynthesis protein BcsQ